MLVAQVGMAIAERQPSRPMLIATSVACVLLSLESHLVLDAIPHYNWIVYLKWFRGLPLHGFIREAVLASPIVALAFYLGRGHSVLTGACLLASIYPDIEKFVYCDLHGPKALILFRIHSLQFSANNGGLSHPALIALELSILATLVFATIVIPSWCRKIWTEGHK